jgi:hypothetical protein
MIAPNAETLSLWARASAPRDPIKSAPSAAFSGNTTRFGRRSDRHGSIASTWRRNDASKLS